MRCAALGAAWVALCLLAVSGAPAIGVAATDSGGKAAGQSEETAGERDGVEPKAKPEVPPALLPTLDPAPPPHLDVKGQPDEGEKARKRPPAVPAEKILIYDSSEGGHIQDLRLDPVVR